ncbi:protein BatD [Corallococcus sp. H22C18031201]|uniref:BatD family protein n=1 Tax=Citreicoccus inhibens TaxID=2849499 RepID=UPI000E760A58|nr:BatD family protein [Citreicoccus inhibens]MBU8899277.1 BatD family protein [Citreicoccus inhibens]RJS25758.1 protein BatD [Corallococcus sp. H22C18031201]
MRRTGSGRAAWFAVLALLATAPAWADDIEFYQTADRTEVGTEDAFHLTVVVVNAPANAQVRLPQSEDFEVLSNSRSSQRSISLSGGGPAVIQDVTRHMLVLRPNRAGSLTIPPAILNVGGRQMKTEPVRVTVKEGHASQGSAQGSARPALPDPFRNMPSTANDTLGEDEEADEPVIPRGDSDLFLRSTLDRDDVYVGEQVTLSLYVYSRVDLSSVDSVTMPKLEGFWSEAVENPTQLSSDQKIVDGIPYRTYLLRRSALFPVKPGALTISAAEADITTGFLFAGHRVHRIANALKVKVRPLPAGAPPGMSNANVGNWRLSLDVSNTRVELGQPVTVKVVLEGTGNVKNITPPKLTGPASLKVYDPTTTDKLTPSRNRIQGRRVVEYLVMPQRTGAFTLPALEFPYFDPSTRRYEVARTEPVTLNVEAGAGGSTSLGTQTPRLNDSASEQKNVLTSGGIRPVRYQARFEAPATPVWQRPFFATAVLAPLGLLAGVALMGGVRGRLATRTEAGKGKQQARAARKRLAAAEKLRAGKDAGAFYVEVEKGLLGFLDAQVGAPLGGLTRDALGERLAAAGVDAERRARVQFVLEACDMGRYGGGVEPAERQKVLEAAAAVMEGWGR